MLKAALRELTLVHVMNAARRQVAADLCTKRYPLLCSVWRICVGTPALAVLN